MKVGTGMEMILSGQKSVLRLISKPTEQYNKVMKLNSNVDGGAEILLSSCKCAKCPDPNSYW